MLLKISNITYLILINIYASLINANNKPTTNISAFLIDNRNNSNNCEKDRKDCTLAVKCQMTIKKSANLFSIDNISKYIKFTYF